MVGDYGIWVGKHISRPSFLRIVCGRSPFHITRITFHITHLSLKCVTGLTHYSEGCVMCNACREMWISLPLYSNVPLHTTRSTQRVRYASSLKSIGERIFSNTFLLFVPAKSCGYFHNYFMICFYLHIWR